MRAWLARVLLPFWVVFYYFIAHGVTTVLALHYGVVPAAVAIFFIAGIWGCIFYLLLCIEGSLDRLQRHIARLVEKQDQGLPGKVKNKLGGETGKLLVSWGWVLFVFAIFGTLAGVLTVRLGRTDKPFAKDILLIWIGCLFSGIGTTIIVYGPLMFAARGILALIFGGG